MNFDILRQDILEKAIQGKLVPQLDSEPSVEQIGEAPEDVPFDIPKKWKWVKFSDACVNFSPHDYQIKTSEVMKEGEYPVVSQSQKLIDGYCDDKTKLVPKDKLPFIVFGDHTRVVKYINFQCIIGADGTKLIHSAFYDLKYLFYAIMAVVPSTKDRGYSRHYQFLKKSLIPLPPLEEQRRIVAKVDALFEQIDLAEKAHKELSGPLSDRFRALVLEQAIQGKLVPQLNSEPAVEQIGDVPEDVPFAIPEKWAWRKIGDLSAKRKTVDPKDIDETIVELWSIPAYDEGSPQIVPAKTIGSSKKIVTQGDILLAKIVPHIKRVWIVKDRGNGLKKLASTEWLVFTSKDIDQEYLCLAMKSPYFNNNMLKTVSGMGSLKRANPKEIAKIFVPIPPLEEQRRIVARVEALLKEVDAIAR